MKTSFLTTLGIVGLFASLLPSASPAYAASQPQQLSSPMLIYAQADSATMGQEGVVPVTYGRRNTPILFDLVQELHALPVGKRYSYYRQVLEQEGYIVLDNFNDNRHWEFDLEKINQNLRLTIAHDADTGNSTAITASGPRVAD